MPLGMLFATLDMLYIVVGHWLDMGLLSQYRQLGFVITW